MYGIGFEAHSCLRLRTFVPNVVSTASLIMYAQTEDLGFNLARGHNKILISVLEFQNPQH